MSKNSVRYSSEKVILSSCGLFTLASLGLKRTHEDKITFLHLYGNSILYTTREVKSWPVQRKWYFRSGHRENNYLLSEKKTIIIWFNVPCANVNKILYWEKPKNLWPMHVNLDFLIKESSVLFAETSFMPPPPPAHDNIFKRTITKTFR